MGLYGGRRRIPAELSGDLRCWMFLDYVLLVANFVRSPAPESHARSS
jgi:hypothetical protein